MAKVDGCPECGRQKRLNFADHIKLAVECGKLPNGRLQNQQTGEAVPAGEASLNFSISPRSVPTDGSLFLRAAYLKKELSRLSAKYFDSVPTHREHHRWVDDFLSAVADEGLPAPEIHRQVHEWLSNHIKTHPSLWPEWVFLLRQKILRAAIGRRVARSELWVVQNLLTASTHTSRCEACDSNMRETLAFHARSLVKVGCFCSNACTNCNLPCMNLKGHEGDHDCGTDHCCHSSGPQGTCTLCAGHDGDHDFKVAWPGTKSGESSECVVCLEVLGKGGEEDRLSCKHLFHSFCIRQWVAEKGTCPVCRHPADIMDLLSECPNQIPRSAVIARHTASSFPNLPTRQDAENASPTASYESPSTAVVPQISTSRRPAGGAP